MRTTFAALACCVLSACGTTPAPAPEAVVRTVEVPMQVSVPCIKQTPQRPAFRTEAEILSSTDYDASFWLWEEWEKLTAYTGQLEAILPACVQPKETP